MTVLEHYLHELYYLEIESNRLTFESDLEYYKAQEAFSTLLDHLRQHNDHRECERLWEYAMSFSDTSARLAFGYGFRLAMSLAMGRG
ncbi:DUF6809 family protein [Pseudoflavonifractor phocaeensis]|uniref:DUF6809 family protein n=1 Tax=Pseudoflavonifractor phocaeensis TaxID=1870988 RepID=UPI003364D9E6